jgi:hypothetical protein
MAVRHHLGARNACDGTHGLLCEERLSARAGARALYQLSRGAERRGERGERGDVESVARGRELGQGQGQG